MSRFSIPDCYDPIEQERQRDLAYTAQMMRRPRCHCCDQRIFTETYLSLQEFGINGYVCEKCIESNTHYTYEMDDDDV